MEKNLEPNNQNHVVFTNEQFDWLLSLFKHIGFNRVKTCFTDVFRFDWVEAYSDFQASNVCGVLFFIRNYCVQRAGVFTEKRSSLHVFTFQFEHIVQLATKLLAALEDVVIFNSLLAANYFLNLIDQMRLNLLNGHQVFEFLSILYLYQVFRICDRISSIEILVATLFYRADPFH